MNDRSRLALAIALSVAVPVMAAVILAPSVVAGTELSRTTLLLLIPGVLGVALAVFIALRHDDTVGERLRVVERERVEFRRAVARLGDTLAATRDLGRLAEVALHEAVATVEGAAGVFYSVNPARMRLQARAHVNAELEGEPEWGAGVAGAVASWGRAVISPRDAACEGPEPQADTAVAVPLFSRGAIFGVLAVYGSATGAKYSDDTVETLLALARHTEAAIDNVYLQEETRRLSITDGLTGLWNRREFELRCRQEFERAARFQRSFAVLLLDVDKFKEINDTWGHHGGDSVLVELAGRLAQVTREIDTVARYGGDEFAMLLPETGTEGAAAVGEKIREVVRASPFEFEGQRLPTSVSIGVASYPEDGVSARQLVVAADEALYQAKRGGRDQVAVASDGAGAPPEVVPESAGAGAPPEVVPGVVPEVVPEAPVSAATPGDEGVEGSGSPA